MKLKNVFLGTLLFIAGGFNLQAVGPAQIKLQIEQELIKMSFFRPDLIKIIKQQLPSTIQLDDIPNVFRTPWLFNIFQANKISVAGGMPHFSLEKPTEQQIKLKQIIEEDNLDQLQQETEKGINIYIKDSFFEVDNVDFPLLSYCVREKATKCFKFLILNGADPSKELIRKNPDFFIDDYHWDCIPIAVCFGEWEMMKILEERGIDKLNNPSVWEAAALTHRNKLLKLLISNKNQISNFEECLRKGLFGATKGDNLKGFRLLSELSKGAYINVVDGDSRTLLCIAAEYGSSKIGELLISKGADVNVSANFCRTPLHFAAESDSIKIGELLISKGANINAKDVHGATPLHLAAGSDSIKIGELLISKGANINGKSSCYIEKTPLHYAAESDSVKMGELLISKGADINAKDKKGEAPLHIALRYNLDRIIELLISKGADINAKNIYGETPLTIALKNKQFMMQRLLLSKGAKE